MTEKRYTLKQKAALELFRGWRQAETRLHQLRYLFWECTLRCNLHCRHCGSDCRTDSGFPDMPAADFYRVLDSLAGSIDPHETMLVLTGGEPLLRGDLEECGREFYRREFPWGLVTNGMLLTEKKLDGLLASGLRSLTVSLDGLEETHNRFRCHRDSFANASRAIRAAARQTGLVFDVVTCLHPANAPELSEIRDLLTGWGVRQWRIVAIFPKGRAAANSDLATSADNLKELMGFIEETRKQGVIKASFGCDGFLGPWEGIVRNGFFFCRAGVNIGSVMADGSISACPSLRSDFIQGNIYNEDFRGVWETRFGNMRDRSWARQGDCGGCKQWKYCQGNGLHLWDEDSRSIGFCHYNLLSSSSQRV
jgi:radical SAM enzyme (rSAM/lipoprotein system)